jgi:signal transduction histidine kinase
MRLQPDWCDLRLVIEAAVALLPTAWSAALEVSCDRDVPVIWADHDRLEQVFVNLLANAFHHNPPGIHVTIAAHPAGESRVEISVSDDGEGFPEDLRANPFDTTRRPQSRTAGAGLGLSIAKGIIEAHDGTIVLRQPGRGTTFQITLPVEVPGAPADPAELGLPARA